MKYYLKTFGCQMNQSDSQRIAGVLEKSGLTPTAEKEADFLIANICSVRERAIDRVYALVKKWQNYKAKIILTGCLLEKDKMRFKKSVDLILPIQDILKLPQLLKLPTRKINCTKYLNLPAAYQSRLQSYVPIMNGCNNFCSYCVVPYTRGREVSRPAEDIIKEVKCLVRKGYKEITLLGQNVNSYKCKIKNVKCKITIKNSKLLKNKKSVDFPILLRMIDAIPGNFWIRFMTSHPKDMSDELIKTIAQSKKVCEYIHLPVQAGDNQILEKMNRKYTVRHYLNLIKKIRGAIPRVAISTDIIVGFPGETRQQFENTVALFKKVRFDMAYIAQYSPRPETSAWKLKDTVSTQEKKRRFKILNQLLKKVAQQKNQKLIGKTEEALVEKCQDGFCFGRTRGNKSVKFEYPLVKGNGTSPLIRGDKRGVIIKVKIIKAIAWGLLGEIKKAM